MIPLRDPTPLFNRITRDGALFFGHVRGYGSTYIFPEFAQKLWTLTAGTDVLKLSQYDGRFFWHGHEPAGSEVVFGAL